MKRLLLLMILITGNSSSMERPIKAEDNKEVEKTPKQATTMEEYCELEMKKLEREWAKETILKSLKSGHMKELQPTILHLQAKLKRSEISSQKAISFFESFMSANCSLKKNPDGTLSISFQNWLDASQWYELSMNEIDTIMRASREHVVNAWKTKIVPAWNDFTQSTYDISDEQKYFAILYIYRNFMKGHQLQNNTSNPPSSELAQVRKEYQNALQAGDSQKFNECNRFRLHPEGYTFFYDHEMNRRAKGCE